jgi:hypothetical protein
MFFSSNQHRQNFAFQEVNACELVLNTTSLSATISKEELKQEVQDYIEMIDKGESPQECKVLHFLKEKMGRFPTPLPITLQY